LKKAHLRRCARAVSLDVLKKVRLRSPAHRAPWIWDLFERPGKFKIGKVEVRHARESENPVFFLSPFFFLM
jgi:hypothetical protein